MKQVFKATAILVIAPLMFFAVLPVFAVTDTECTPPYGNYVGVFPTATQCSVNAPYCSKVENSYYGYGSTNVGKNCTNDTGVAGECDNSGNCAATGGNPPAGGTVLGANNCPPGTPPGITCLPNPLGVSTFDALLNKIIDFIFWVGITVAPVIFIIAGFLFVTSAGDAKKLETAKHMMLYTVIGLVVLLLARGLVAVLKSVIGVQ